MTISNCNPSLRQRKWITRTTHSTVITKASHPSPTGCTCWSQPLPLTHETSPGPVEPPHLGFSPDVFSCNRSPGDDPPASLGGAEEVRVIFCLTK